MKTKEKQLGHLGTAGTCGDSGDSWDMKEQLGHVRKDEDSNIKICF